MPWPKGKPKPAEWRKRVSETLRAQRGRTIICAYCGRAFKPWWSKSKYCSRTCANRATALPKGVFPPQWATQEAREKNRLAHTGIHYLAEVNKKKGLLGIFNPFFGKHHSAKTRLLMSQRAKERGENPQYVRKLLARLRIKPTTIERQLDLILQEHFPREWKYVGDGTLMIGKYNPDFANCNGKKQLIEIYGEYWHSSRNKRLTWDKTELGRMMAYNSLGFQCLVIWASELKNEQLVVHKIKQFMGR